jgi:hypothetical protein
VRLTCLKPGTKVCFPPLQQTEFMIDCTADTFNPSNPPTLPKNPSWLHSSPLNQHPHIQIAFTALEESGSRRGGKAGDAPRFPENQSDTPSLVLHISFVYIILA